MTELDLRPITSALGAEVWGLDLSRPLGDAQRDAVAGALADHLMLAFRGQDLGLDDLERFARQFGSFGETPFITPVEGHPDIVAVVREADEEGPLFGGAWHSDWSFQERPPSATILYAKEVPACGGDTLFTNQYLAYESLSTGLRRMVEGLKAVHSARRSYGPKGTFGRPDPRSAMEIHGGEAALGTRLHPLVRTHPVTGRKALFVNEVYTVGLEDMAPPESAAILRVLFERSRQAALTCRLHWQAGTLAMWDNRCTQHYAIDDYRGARREMYRMTLAGERPV